MKKRHGEHEEYVDYPVYTSQLVTKRLRQFRHLGSKSMLTMDDSWISATWYRTDYSFMRDAKCNLGSPKYKKGVEEISEDDDDQDCPSEPDGGELAPLGDGSPSGKEGPSDVEIMAKVEINTSLNSGKSSA